MQYKLYIENQTPYLINNLNGEKEYKILCIDSSETFIKVEGLLYTDKIRMYVKNIQNFDCAKMRNILPECYV